MYRLGSNPEKRKEDDEEYKPETFKEWVWLWIRDFAEVGVTLAAILLILRITLGAHMLVPLVVVTSGSMVHEPGDEGWVRWLTERNLTADLIQKFPLSDGFNRGDMIVTISPEARLGDVIIYERDLAHLNLGSNEPIIHRIVGVVLVKDWAVVNTSGTLDCLTKEEFEKKYVKYVRDCVEKTGYCVYPYYPESGSFGFYITKGDHNPASDQCSGYSVLRNGIAFPVNEAQVSARGWVRIPYLGYLKLLLNTIIRALFFWV